MAFTMNYGDGASVKPTATSTVPGGVSSLNAVTTKPIATPVPAPKPPTTSTAKPASTSTIPGGVSSLQGTKPATAKPTTTSGTNVTAPKVDTVTPKSVTGGATSGTTKPVSTTTKPTTTSTTAPKTATTTAKTATTAPKTATTTAKPTTPVKSESQIQYDNAQKILNDTAYKKNIDDMTTAIMDNIKQTNPYIDKLNTMTFDYNVQSDPEYLRDSANLENQIAQVMAARGGSYSNIAQSALQSGLIDLQMNFNKLKRQEYLEERNWTMEMARFDNQTKGEYFNKLVTLKNSIQADKKAEFETAMSLAEYNAQKEMNTWNMAMKEKEFNAQQEDRAFEKKMALENQSIARANADAIKKQNQMAAELQNSQAKLGEQVLVWKNQKTDYNNIYDRFTKSQKGADEVVSAYFKKYGLYVPVGGSFAAYGYNFAKIGTKLDNMENDLIGSAYELNEGKNVYAVIDSINNPPQTYNTVSTTTESVDGLTKTTTTSKVPVEKTVNVPSGGYDGTVNTTTSRYKPTMG